MAFFMYFMGVIWLFSVAGPVGGFILAALFTGAFWGLFVLHANGILGRTLAGIAFVLFILIIAMGDSAEGWGVLFLSLAGIIFGTFVLTTLADAHNDWRCEKNAKAAAARPPPLSGPPPARGPVSCAPAMSAAEREVWEGLMAAAYQRRPALTDRR
jgi:hypothetical protein